jgi:hypothetical protein
MAKLRILLTVCFLRELEFPNGKVLSLLSKQGVYQHLRQMTDAQRGRSI